jgi:hypothetical protein
MQRSSPFAGQNTATLTRSSECTPTLTEDCGFAACNRARTRSPSSRPRPGGRLPSLRNALSRAWKASSRARFPAVATVLPIACGSPGTAACRKPMIPTASPRCLGEMDVWLLAEGSHLRPFERLGAHLCAIDGVAGTVFAVWAPDAQRVSVVGDFNTWDGRRHPMRLRRECGVWEIFLPGVSRRGPLQVRNTLPRWPSAATQGRSLRLPGRNAAIHGVDRLCAAATRGAGVGAGG